MGVSFIEHAHTDAPCSLQVTFCKSVLNLNRPGQELDTTAMESGLDLNRSGGSVWACSIKDGKCSKVNRAHPSAVREKRSLVDQGMDLVQDLDQEQDEYLEMEDNYTNEDHNTATPNQHQDENIGQAQGTMTMES